jgi:hypothetical protein
VEVMRPLTGATIPSSSLHDISLSTGNPKSLQPMSYNNRPAPFLDTAYPVVQSVAEKYFDQSLTRKFVYRRTYRKRGIRHARLHRLHRSDSERPNSSFSAFHVLPYMGP